MNILLRFQDPDWIFRQPSTEDEQQLEELDPEDEDLEELELMDDGGFDGRRGAARADWEDDGIDDLPDDTLSPAVSKRRG